MDAYIPQRVLDNMPAMIRAEVSKLNATQQEQFLEEYQRKEKSTPMAYVLSFLGLHYAYLGRWGLTLLMWITWYGLLVWWIIDLFRMPGLVQSYNRDLATETLRTMRIVSTD